MLNKLLLVLLALAPATALAQGTLRGVVSSAEEGPLPGANVVLEGTTYGVATNIDGVYALQNVPAGTYELNVSYVGFEPFEQSVTIRDGQTQTLDVTLAPINTALAAAEVFASRAIDRTTPVAYTDVSKEEIEARLGSRDIPMVLNTAPSVYATEQGGGAGDARINVRGFDQRNTAVMINGVPVNDMENGWVYWSNWDGVGDVTTSIQLQRGLSAVNLAVPSVGGTLNILTDPAELDAGVLLKQEAGSGGFFKTTVGANTGLIDGKYAVSALGVRKVGNGVFDGVWTDAWAYYLAGTYNVSDRNIVSLYAVGAPQRHGQNLYRQNIGTYDSEFALGLDGYDPAALDKFQERGREFNQNIAPIGASYTGQQAVGGSLFNRYDDTFLMERENFYHKPQVNLNWYSQISDQLLFSTVAYYSGGVGGGTGTLGRLLRRDANGVLGDEQGFFTGPSPWAWAWDETVAINAGPAGDYMMDGRARSKVDGQSLGILRNSRNNQNTVGVISKFAYDVSDALKTEVGVDLRTASIDHYREVRDLLGGEFFIDSSDEFAGERRVGLGDKIDYYNNNTVNWAGAYAQAEIDQDLFTAFAMGGVTSISYDYEDFFREENGETLKLDSGVIPGFTVKTGGLYRASDALGVFVNAGYISKVPIFDGVINDVTGVLNPDVENEDIMSLEGGVNFRTPTAAVKLSGYLTSWANRTVNRGTDVIRPDGSSEEAVIFLRGVEQQHIGAEVEVAWQPVEMARIDAGISVGDWKFTNDVEGTFALADRSQSLEVFVPIADLKVGDQPQTQLAYGLTLMPIDGLNVQFLGRTYMRNFSNFDAVSRALIDADGDGDFDFTDSDGDGVFDEDADGPDRTQSWEAPGYSVFDLAFRYRVPQQNLPFGVDLTANVFNLLDTTYIQDAFDNSRFNRFDGDHDADDAEVYLGLPRRFNVGVRLTY